MSTVGQIEKLTQARLVAYCRHKLGYDYLGDLRGQANRNIKQDLLRAWLSRQGREKKLTDQVISKLEKANTLSGSKSLYEANREVYELLRYGVNVKPTNSNREVRIQLIDWKNPENNHFAIAEEVTVKEEHEKRPDVVLYVNGIALVVLELKRSLKAVSEGIRQSLDNQNQEFIKPFFTTVQLVLAGNDSEGLRYGVIETREKYYMEWKEQDPAWTPRLPGDTKYLPVAQSGAETRLDAQFGWMCGKKRLLDIVHNFMVFDKGNKKTCRPNQYFGVHAAQKNVIERRGGILWHTQGSGKSLTMVWLAKWIRENAKDDPRVLIITDRTELDEQIEEVFNGVNERIRRTKSGADMVGVLNSSTEWLVCSLIQKFGGNEEMSDADVDAWIEQFKKSLPSNFRPKGSIFVFVDECHRTQSGKLHKAMKKLLPGAVLIGYTGTPLLKKDKQKSIEVFGPYIHTYKFDEAVRDKVILDLLYEARDIDQHLGSQKEIDETFAKETRNLSDLAKAELKERWAVEQNIYSSRDRLLKMADNILRDMIIRDRLRSGRGNALLVTDSIYSACRLFRIFRESKLKGKCAVVSSYRPNIRHIKGEESGEGKTEAKLKYEVYKEMLMEHFQLPEDAAIKKAEDFEKEVKERFVKTPGQMKLLIVVDKLLTGFDAPPATYLYIDKIMRDHGLFQAVCRVNRLAGEDKRYGYIVDYRDLFKSLKKSIKDYTGQAFADYDQEDIAGLLEDRISKGRERLDQAREAIKALCEPVQSYDTEHYLRYFCNGETGAADELQQNEAKRIALYKLVSAYIRAYANIATDMDIAGYTPKETAAINWETGHYEKVRQEVKLASGDYVDLQYFEPFMRHLLDAYISADASRAVSAFEDKTLIQLIVEHGADAINEMPEDLRNNPDVAAETIENNVRRLIIDQKDVNPRYYENISELLDELVKRRKQKALEYKAYLDELVALVKRAAQPERATNYPPEVRTAGQRALYDNLEVAEGPIVAEAGVAYGGESSIADRRAAMVLRLHDEIKRTARADWRDSKMKTREVLKAVKSVLGEQYAEQLNKIMAIVEKQHEY